MSWRGGGRGSGDRGGHRGGFRGRGAGGGSRPSFNRYEDYGPPESVVETGAFLHACEGEMVYRMTAAAQVPKFNASVYLENKTQIGKVEEVLGPLSEVYFSVKPIEGVQATSFRAGDKAYMAQDKLMPLQRFTQPSDIVKSITKGGGGGRGGRGGRGGGRGGFGRGRGGRGRGGGGFTGGRGSGSFGRGGGRGGGGRGGGWGRGGGSGHTSGASWRSR